jgi:hypothetical protein
VKRVGGKLDLRHMVCKRSVSGIDLVSVRLNEPEAKIELCISAIKIIPIPGFASASREK